jgi:hypothetical protein
VFLNANGRENDHAMTAVKAIPAGMQTAGETTPHEPDINRKPELTDDLKVSR